MNTDTNPLLLRGNIPVIRAMFLAANMAERSLLSQIYHELATFYRMAGTLHYDAGDYRHALRDYLTALAGRYHVRVSFSDELNPADKKETTDGQNITG